MARKPVDTSSGSSLSPPPSNSASVTDEVLAAQTQPNRIKRKTAAPAKPAIKRAKQSTAADTEVGEKVHPFFASDASSRRRAAATKAVITEEATDALRAIPKTTVRTISTSKKKNETGTTTLRGEKFDEENQGEIDTTQIQNKRRPLRGRMTEEDPEVTLAKKVVKRKVPVLKELKPLAERTIDSKLCVGAHVSAAGGVHNALINLVHIGGNAFALFLKNHRKWDHSELDPTVAQLFLDGCKEHSINVAETCVPHGSYLVNLAHPDAARKAQAYASFINDLHRCHKLGIRFYNFHPGNANAGTREQGIETIAHHLNQAHQDPATGNVITLLETMATQGNTIGGTFADLAAIIALVKDKSRVGVCLDTCHVFAAGYDLRSRAAYQATLDAFEQTIGLAYLKALHVNDSKAPLFSHRDLHARIGTGYLGLRAFHNLVNDVRMWGLPMILETPCEVMGGDGRMIEDKGVWAREIKLLESLVGMDVDAEEFKTLEAELQDEGLAERQRIGEQVDRRGAKKAKDGVKVPAKGTKKATGKAKNKVGTGDEQAA